MIVWLVRIFVIAKRWKEHNFPDALQGLDNEPNRLRGRSNSMDSWEALGSKLADEGTDIYRYAPILFMPHRQIPLFTCILQAVSNSILETTARIIQKLVDIWLNFGQTSKVHFQKVCFLIKSTGLFQIWFGNFISFFNFLSCLVNRVRNLPFFRNAFMLFDF